MWQQPDYITIDEIKIGKIVGPNGPLPYPKKLGTHLRLVETETGKRYIQLYSTLSKQWNIMYRYEIEASWKQWKKHANIHD